MFADGFIVGVALLLGFSHKEIIAREGCALGFSGRGGSVLGVVSKK
ncbi:hypothetical protein V6Z11_D04G060100 [Gossypium hirsutum]